MAKSSRRSSWLPVIVAGLASPVLTAAPATAYMGPGAGLTAIGTALGVIAALLLAVVGFIWYPMKRLLRRRKADEPAAATRASAEPNADPRGGADD